MEISYFYYNEKSFMNNLRRNKKLYGEEFAKVVNSDKKLKSLTTFLLANALMVQKALAETTPELEESLTKVDLAGGTFLTIIQRFGYWICLILCAIEIIRSLMQGDTKSIGKSVFKYILAFATFFFLPWIFDLIKGIFK